MATKWCNLPFQQLLAEPVRNGIYKSREFHGRGAKIVNMGELFAHPRLGMVPMKRVALSDSEVGRFALAEGDLLFARRSLVAEGAGKCTVVLAVEEPTVFESSIIRARPDPEKADSLFLYYYFNSSLGLHRLDTIRRQVAVAGITGSDLSRLEIPVPALSEQHGISRILGTLDKKIELNRAMSETLDSIARGLFKSWFMDFDPVRVKVQDRQSSLRPSTTDLFPSRLVEFELGEAPEGWEVKPLPEIIDVNPARTLRKGDLAPYVGMASMPIQGHSPDGPFERPFGSGMCFKNGDTLVARITPCLENGKTAFVDFLADGQVGWGSTEYIVLCPKPPLPAEFAYCLARSEVFREFAIQSMTGSSGRQRVPANSLAHFTLVDAPLPVTECFARLVKPLLARAGVASRESKTLAVLRDTLLHELFSGRLPVPEGLEIVEAAV